VIVKKKIKIRNPQGLHARPASIFVKIANRFESEVTVRKGSEAVNGKSIMGLMTLAANQGSVLELEISGADAQKALEELEQFLLSDTEEEGAK
jgi:phosphocarrier protein HPr